MLQAMSIAPASAVDTFGMGLLNVDAVRERRIALGLSQEDAAGRAGLRGGRARWNNIEKGGRVDIKLSTLEQIARALECSPADLLVASTRKK